MHRDHLSHDDTPTVPTPVIKQARVTAMLAGIVLVGFVSGCGGKSKPFAELAKMQKEGDKVVGIVFRYEKLEHDSLDEITNYPDVRTVTIQECEGVTDDMLKQIAKLKKLEAVELLNVSVSDKGLAHFADHPKFSKLLLGNTQVTGTGLSHLAKSLVSLELRGGDVTPDGAKSIAKLVELETLMLHCPSIKMTDLPDLKGMKALRNLESYRTPNGEGVGAVVATIPKLESLWLGGTGLVDKDLGEISKLSTLRVLNLSAAELTDAGLVFVNDLSELDELYLGSCMNLTDEGLAHLSGLTKLTYLDLMDSNLNGSGLMHLAPLTSLELIEFTAEQFTHAKSIIKEFNKIVPNCEVALVQG